MKPTFCCNTEVFQTLVSNLPEPPDNSYLSDLTGINIADDNLYAEMRHQFYVWKNFLSDYDYIGFEHYRRPFFIDHLPAQQLQNGFPDILTLRYYFTAFNVQAIRRDSAGFGNYMAMRRSLDESSITSLKKWLGNFDVVVPRANNEDIEMQWKSCKDPDEWHVMVDCINRSKFFSERENLLYFRLAKCYFANSYIMRCDLLDEYLTFCFEVLADLRNRVTLVPRALGFFSERLFSFWLYQRRVELPTLRVLELPLLFHDPALDPVPTQ
jgi:Domain of unknown function (DUF4422)